MKYITRPEALELISRCRLYKNVNLGKIRTTGESYGKRFCEEDILEIIEPSKGKNCVEIATKQVQEKPADKPANAPSKDVNKTDKAKPLSNRKLLKKCVCLSRYIFAHGKCQKYFKGASLDQFNQLVEMVKERKNGID